MASMQWRQARLSGVGMASKRIATTDRSGLSMAQVGGNDVYKLLPQVQSVIELGNLGSGYVKLFAEPVDNGRAIDWYVEEGEDVVPLADLDAARKRELLDRFGEMVSNLQAYAGSLRQNSSSTYRNYADILEKALIVPGMDKSLYSVDGAPVLANWGFSASDNEIVDGAQALIRDIQDRLAKIGGSAKSAPESSNSPSQGEAGGMGAQAAQDRPGPRPIEQAAPARMSGGSGSWIAAALTGAVLLAAGAWVAWQFMHDGPGAQEEAGHASMAWLKGDLNANGVLIDENNDPVDLTLRFSGAADGIGTAIIRSPGQTCSGSVVAESRANNRVAFATQTLTCPNGHNYEPFTMICVRGQRHCSGLNSNGETWELDVNLLGDK